MLFKNQRTYFILFLCLSVLVSCVQNSKEPSVSEVHVVGAMKNVMWHGALGASIQLDTIKNTKGLYGLGPTSYLTGEIVINDGITYVSEVTSDSSMVVEKTTTASAPFFVYTNVTKWDTISLPNEIKSITALEQLVDSLTKRRKRPFAFKVLGAVKSASIHVQNLPAGTRVSSPEEAHQGQTNYILKNEEVTVIGFFSTEHKGIFTHHDSTIHLHLLNKNETRMGHVDAFIPKNMYLLLPN